MFRKSVLALAAVATVAATALIPTSASAHYRGGWWGFRTGLFLSAPLAYGYYNYGGYRCVSWVPTPSGYVKAYVPCGY